MELPSDFSTLMQQTLGKAEADALLRSLDTPSPVSVRLNPRKMAQPPWAGAEPVPWCPDGYYLPSRPAFTLDPLFHAGCYYVQEASSMFLRHALRHVIDGIAAARTRAGEPQAGLRALDLCAAPGGKSTLLLSVLPPGSLLVANEVMPQRAEVLRDNITKWDPRRALVTQNQPRDFAALRDSFDLIVADVPCSGEGMFRKEPAALRQWSLRYVEEMARLQRDIVADAWPSLRPGGFLVYSTCTFNPQEDEGNVQRLLDTFHAESIDLRPDEAWHVLSAFPSAVRADLPAPHAYHLLPSRVRGEGFFLSVMRKPEGTVSPCRRKAWERLHVLLDGPAMPEVDYPQVELPLIEARRYLRGETLTLPASTPRGLVEVCFEGHALGLMKNLGTRANNLYPKSARIRTTHIGDAAEGASAR